MWFDPLMQAAKCGLVAVSALLRLVERVLLDRYLLFASNPGWRGGSYLAFAYPGLSYFAPSGLFSSFRRFFVVQSFTPVAAFLGKDASGSP